MLMYGEFVEDRDSFHKALSAYDASLEVWTRESSPLEWSLNQMGRGNALRNLGRLDKDVAALREAAACYELALEEQSTDIDPVMWAKTQINRANVYALIGDLADDTAAGRQAELTYDAAGRALRATGADDLFQMVGSRSVDLLLHRHAWSEALSELSLIHI